MLTAVEKPDDVRVGQLLQRFNLTTEPLDQTRFTRHGRREHFDGYQLRRLGVNGPVDGSHSAGTQFLLDLIRTDRVREFRHRVRR